MFYTKISFIDSESSFEDEEWRDVTKRLFHAIGQDNQDNITSITITQKWHQ